MKKSIAATAMLFIIPLVANAQLNLQLHHDLGSQLYSNDIPTRPKTTLTVENFTADKWGSTYFFIDCDISNSEMKGAYGEFSRELKLWKAPVAIHLEYDGGLKNSGSFQGAYLFGAAYNWNSKDFRRGFSFQAMYKRYAKGGGRDAFDSWQTTAVWHLIFAHDLVTLSGFADLWHDNNVAGNLIFMSEPQIWFNLAPLKCVDDDFKLSIGSEVELSNKFVWDQNGNNNKFYALPTLALKWTF
jgi:hypothetical protein